jgi:hypothetical protein
LSTSQPATIDASGILLGGIVAALSELGHLTPAQQQARAAEVRASIGTFQPRDPMQIMLIGQAVLLNALFADGARDVLRGMADTLKPRAVSGINGLNRALHQNLKLFLRLHDKSAAASEAAEPRRPTPATVSVETLPPQAKPAADIDQPAEEVSWLDEPVTTWLIETPAEAAARATGEPEAPAVGDAVAAPGEENDAAGIKIAQRRAPEDRPLAGPAMVWAERSAVPGVIGPS